MTGKKGRFKFISTVCDTEKTQHSFFFYLFFPQSRQRSFFLRRRIDTLIRFMFGVLFDIFSENTFSNGIHSPPPPPITKCEENKRRNNPFRILLALSAAVFNLTRAGKSQSMTCIMFPFMSINPFLCGRVCQR